MTAPTDRKAALLLACSVYASRWGRGDDVKPDGVSEAWRTADLSPGTEEWAARYIVQRLLSGAPRYSIDCDLLGFALGPHLPAARDLVDAAFSPGTLHLNRWLSKYAPRAEEKKAAEPLPPGIGFGDLRMAQGRAARILETVQHSFYTRVIETAQAVATMPPDAPTDERTRAAIAFTKALQTAEHVHDVGVSAVAFTPDFRGLTPPGHEPPQDLGTVHVGEGILR